MEIIYYSSFLQLVPACLGHRNLCSQIPANDNSVFESVILVEFQHEMEQMKVA